MGKDVIRRLMYGSLISPNGISWVISIVLWKYMTYMSCYEINIPASAKAEDLLHLP